jgi:hypothetical protein
MDVPYEYIQTRAYDINIGAWICMSKLFSLETNMSKGVGEQWVTFAYPSILTSNICGFGFKVCCSGCVIACVPTQASSKARPHTRLSVYGPWALVVSSKGLEEQHSSSSSFSLYYLFIFSLSLFFLIHFLARQSWHHHFFNQDGLLVWMEHVARFAPSSPTLQLLCKSQVCSVRLSSWVCSITVFSWCSFHVFLASYAPCSSLSQPEMVCDKNIRRCILTWQYVLAFIEKEKLGFYDNHNFFMIIRGISRQCLIYGLELDCGNSSCSWQCSSPLHHKAFSIFVHAARCTIVHPRDLQYLW